MNILASSINTVVETFLHAGYLSASPSFGCRAARSAGFPGEFKDTAAGTLTSLSARLAGSEEWVTLVLGVVCFVALVAGIYFWKRWRTGQWASG